MKSLLKRLANRVAWPLGYEPRRQDWTTPPVNLLVQFRNSLPALNPESRDFLFFCLDHLSHSHSQLLQDMLALKESGSKRDGYFVDIGAANGVDLSNTYTLEIEYGWSGIVVDPASVWHDSLAAHRRVIIDHRCVTDQSADSVMFKELEELSTIETFVGSDGHAATRKAGKSRVVETVSLTDLLREHGAPKEIDYLSIDTEGSELMILSAHDFDAFRPRIITVEHNYTQAREGLHALLTSKRYRRVLEDISLWDDWYVFAK